MKHLLADVNLPDTFFQYHPSASSFDNPGLLISRLLVNAMVFAGVLFFLLIIYSGYQLIIYGGQYNSPQRVAQAKSMITYSTIGFLLVISAYFILQIIKYVTGVDFITPPSF